MRGDGRVDQGTLGLLSTEPVTERRARRTASHFQTICVASSSKYLDNPASLYSSRLVCKSELNQALSRMR
jgi:hypothetical protein